ncbi:MAG: RNA polymerase subunit sigma-24, partial [Phycisphaerae bacterium]|nr:RNA polymerase subunit sigma-24 [Phycisphaerae bacterium]
MPHDRSTVDRDLLRAAADGDRRAVARILEPELDRVHAVCHRMVGRGDVARDLAQDTLVKAIRGLPEFDGRSAIGTWITRIAMNTCLSWLRSQKRAARRDEAVVVRESTGNDGEHTAAWSVQWEERRRSVASAMIQLSPEHRAVLVLRDVRGLEYEQIAEVLEVAPGTVKSRLFRARAALRDAVEAI